MDESWTQRAVVGIGSFFKGAASYGLMQGYKYSIQFYDRTTVMGIKQLGEYIIRFDAPHRYFNYPHININSIISGMKDPHLYLPPGGLQVAEAGGRLIQQIGEYAGPMAVALEAVSVGLAVKDDINNGTSRKTVETAAKTAGSWGGAAAGATAGAGVGTLILPGVGSIVGGVVGTFGGVVLGGRGTSKAVGKICDSYNYDVVVKKCERCGREFQERPYLGEIDKRFCDQCDA